MHHNCSHQALTRIAWPVCASRASCCSTERHLWRQGITAPCVPLLGSSCNALQVPIKKEQPGTGRGRHHGPPSPYIFGHGAGGLAPHPF